MLLTALAIFLVLVGSEVVLFSGAQTWLIGLFGPAGGALSTVLMVFVLPILDIVAAWYAARRISVWFWPDRATGTQQPVRRRRVARQQQF